MLVVSWVSVFYLLDDYEKYLEYILVKTFL
jgi:hypothetical protein